MSLSKLVSRRLLCSYTKCNKITNSYTECRSLSSLLVHKNSLLNSKSINSSQISQNRYFQRKEHFQPKTGTQYAGHLRLMAWLGLLGLLTLSINLGHVWQNYIPNPITDAIDEKRKRMARVVKTVFPIKGRHVLAQDKASTAEDKSSKKKSNSKSRKSGFRDRKIIEYENRIRMYSNPDKVFRYFASLKIIYDQNESHIYMTPDDFLRALTPGIKQPDGLGLDQFRRIDVSKGNKDLSYGLKPDSIFYKLSHFGLINYSDFLFLLTVISVSRRHFEIAFRMFDLNGDGNVEYDEFEKVQNAILSQTSIGKKLGSTRTGYKGVSSALAKYFFGEDLKQKLTTERFLDFQKQLQSELLTLEFERKKPNPISGKIKESDFADLLIAYAGLTEKRRTKMLKRVRKRFGRDEDGLNEEGVSLDDYLSLYNFLQNINDVDIALAVFNIAGASIDQATLKHVAKQVAHVELRDHLIDVLFTLFDENQDGQLSNKEFIAVMKERLRRGLTKPKDTGFLKLLHALWKSLKFDF